MRLHSDSDGFCWSAAAPPSLHINGSMDIGIAFAHTPLRGERGAQLQPAPPLLPFTPAASSVGSPLSSPSMSQRVASHAAAPLVPKPPLRPPPLIATPNSSSFRAFAGHTTAGALGAGAHARGSSQFGAGVAGGSGGSSGESNDDEVQRVVAGSRRAGDGPRIASRMAVAAAAAAGGTATRDGVANSQWWEAAHAVSTVDPRLRNRRARSASAAGRRHSIGSATMELADTLATAAEVDAAAAMALSRVR